MRQSIPRHRRAFVFTLFFASIRRRVGERQCETLCLPPRCPSPAPARRCLLHGSFGIFIATGTATDLSRLSDEVIGATRLRCWTYWSPLFIGDTVQAKAVIPQNRSSHVEVAP